jgi:predicted Fe-Mo cluster-binding NifX family protein
MRVALSAEGRDLDAAVDPRFGRCAILVVVETDDMSFEAVDNDSSSRGGGAGIQTAQVVAHKGVAAVLTGSCGPSAHQTLTAAGIQVFVGCSGKISDVLARFKAGELQPATAPNVASHSGMSGGR